jgi:DNA polymerase III psi subunit
MMNNVVVESIHSQEIYKIGEPLTIMFNKTWDAMSGEEKTLLSKILASIKQSLSTVKIVNQEIFQINNFGENSIVILFGAKALPEVIPYSVVSSNGIQLVQADALHELDDTKKKNLWSAIRQIKFETKQ